jgi:phosphoribosylformimino-5-aminoimidazole carboxamide ribotide isomerase
MSAATSHAAEDPRPFEILPSIDIRGGRVVDLFQGDFARETVYRDAAEAVAERFVAAGARWIHVVDLDGARAGEPANRHVVRRIAGVAAPAGVRLELGGGIRSLEAVRQALDAGAARAVLGTAAVEQPALVTAAIRACGAEAVVVGVDARGGRVATRGWRETSGLPAVELARAMVEAGVVRLIYTDVTRDSTLTEPNFAALDELIRGVPVRVIAAGGVTTVEHIRRLGRLGAEGAIIGSALYAGTLALEDALAAARGGTGRLNTSHSTPHAGFPPSLKGRGPGG